MTKNDSKLAKRQERDDGEILNDDRFLDHGFNRPKVVFFFLGGAGGCGGVDGCMQIGLRMIKKYFIDCTNYDTCMLFTFVVILCNSSL